MGGPPVSGRRSFAISRPPFQVALSSTWASVSASRARPYFSRSPWAMRSLRGGGDRINIPCVASGEQGDAQFDHGHGAPFDDGRVGGR